MRVNAVVVIVAGLALGCDSSPSSRSGSAPAPIPVAVSRVAAADLHAQIEAGGIVEAGTTAHITSRLVAPIQQVHVREGDRVRTGQPLVTLDARELTALAERAAAAMTSATEGSRAAEARVAAADAARRLANATHGRIQTLFDQRSATPQELDQAAASLGAADAQLAGAHADVAAAAASRDAARAAAEAAAVSRSYAVLTAPFNGVVTSRLADPGSLASPGVPLLVVEESGAVRLDVRVDQSRAGRITPGQAIPVSLDDARTDAWLSATVIEVGRADPGTHTVVMKLQLPAGTTARTGSFGRARLPGDVRRTLVVPTSSIVRRAALTFVFTVDAESTARLRPVVIGAVEEGQTEILAGVSEGRLVIVNPPPALTDGARLAVDSAAIPAKEAQP